MKKEKIKKLLPFAAEILKNADIRTILSPSEQEQAERIVRILLYSVSDLRARKIILLRANGACWKTIQRNVNLSRWQARRLYDKGIFEICREMEIKNTFSRLV